MNKDFLTIAFNRVRTRFLKLGDADDEDALQEAFCRLWSRRDKIDGSSHAEGLLVTTLRNIRIDSERRRLAHPSVELDDISDIPSCDEEYSVAEIYKRVSSLAGECLSERDREILFLRERDGKDFIEIAEMFNLSESNVRMIVSRARKSIRVLYQKQKGH